jgi:hypothetical protein
VLQYALHTKLLVAKKIRVDHYDFSVFLVFSEHLQLLLPMKEKLVTDLKLQPLILISILGVFP